MSICFTEERLILCEGSSDKAFLCQLISHLGLSGFQVQYPRKADELTGGIDKFGSFLLGSIDDGFLQKVKGVLVIADNDDNPNENFVRVQSQLRFSGYGVPVEQMRFTKSPRNMHKSKRERIIKGRGSVGKTTVMGILERQGRVRAKVIKSSDRETLHNEIKEHVEAGSNLFTDEWQAYQGLADAYIHEVINHSIAYVREHIHTNGIENFWSLLKRTIRGTYVSVEPFHLDRYLSEQVFRYNERKRNDKERFLEALKAVSGRRLTYDSLIGYQTY